MKRTFLRRHLLIVLFVVFASLVLISLNVRGNADPLLLAEVVHVVLSPAQRLVRLIGDSFEDVWAGYIALVHLRQKNERLREANRNLRSALEAKAELQYENERLRRLLDLKERTSLTLMAARVIGHAATNWSQTIVLNRGRRDKVRRSMAVVSQEGIIGQVVVTSYTTSQALLITDVRSAVDGLVQRTRASGVLVGRNTSLLRMKFIPLGEDMRLGDRIISTGNGGIYPPGLLVGHINDVTIERDGLFQTAEVVPSVNLRRLEEVFIVVDQPS